MSIISFWKKSITNKLIFVTSFLWVALAVVSIFFDLTISKGLYNSTAVLPKIIENFGEIPGALVGIFALFILGLNWEMKNKKIKILVFLAEVATSTFSIIFILNLILTADNINFNFISLLGEAILLGAILISLIGFYMFETKLRNFSKRHFLFGKVASITFVISGIFAEVAKRLWGRVRFENLASNFSNFTPWYIPQGITGGHSFPSGHAYLSAMTITLTILVLYNKRKWKKWFVGLLTGLFTVFICYERIIGGYHYLSDVVFGAFFTILTLLIVYNINSKNKKSKFPTTKPKKRKKK